LANYDSLSNPSRGLRQVMAHDDTTTPKHQATYIRLWPLALLVALLGILVFGDKGLLRLLQLERQLSQLQGELKRGEETNETLRLEIESLRNDPKTIEGIARKELGMVKKDEIVYQFRTSGKKTTSETPSPPQSAR